MLEEVSHRPDVSQRQLADRLGVALGATNLLIRRLTDQGYIQASQVGWRRWSYAITDSGESHKAQLAQRVVKQFLHQYRAFRVVVTGELEAAGISPTSKVAVVGTGEMRELVDLSLRELGVDVAARPEPRPETPGEAPGETPGEVALDSIGPDEYDYIVVATAEDSSGIVDRLVGSGVSEGRVVTVSGREPGARQRSGEDS